MEFIKKFSPVPCALDRNLAAGIGLNRGEMVREESVENGIAQNVFGMSRNCSFKVANQAFYKIAFVIDSKYLAGEYN